MNKEHSITIQPHQGRVLVRLGDRVIADTTRALVLAEAGYGPVFYFPADDVDGGALVPSDHETHCPHKGDASYYSLQAGGQVAKNAVWTYPAPLRQVAAIEGHLAFYPNKVSIEEV